MHLTMEDLGIEGIGKYCFTYFSYVRKIGIRLFSFGMEFRLFS